MGSSVLVGQQRPALVAELFRPSALINVDSPGCGALVVRDPMGHKEEGFHPGVQLYPKVSSPKVPTSRRIK